MCVNSLPKTVTRQRRGCDLNLGPTVPEFSMLTTLVVMSITTICCQLSSTEVYAKRDKQATIVGGTMMTIFMMVQM